MPSSALERAKLKSNELRKVNMLKAFRRQIECLGNIVLEPDVRRRKMAKLVKEWIPELENTGVARDELSRTLQGIRFSNDIGRCAKVFVDSFYLVRDHAHWPQSIGTSGDSRIDSILNTESVLRMTVCKSILSQWNRPGPCHEQENFELEDVSGGHFEVGDLENCEEKGWLRVENKVDTDAGGASSRKNQHMFANSSRHSTSEVVIK